MSGISTFSEMLQAITERGRQLLSYPAPREAAGRGRDSLETLCDTLLSSRGEASGMALASIVLDRWTALDADGRAAFMTTLLERFGPDEPRLAAAIEAYRAAPSAETVGELHEAAEPRRQEIIRRLNLAPGGVGALVRMREDLLAMLPDRPQLAAVDADFAHLLGSWFNRGFLALKPIDWSTPANVLEKIIRYEAVHEIHDWNELRRRVEPSDRRCFAFFHPQLADEPLIFVEVALTTAMTAAVGDLLEEGRVPIPAQAATTAVFYSISNCQDGLRGVSFGNFLIKQVVADLRQELPGLKTFVTLSPAPGFAGWLARERETSASGALEDGDGPALAALDDRGWMDDAAAVERLRPILSRAAARYLMTAKNARGLAADPVARFHLGNGARLERVNFLADRSARAVRQAHGVMVNYLYELSDIETNHEAFVGRGEVIASAAAQRLLGGAKGAHAPARPREPKGEKVA